MRAAAVFVVSAALLSGCASAASGSSAPADRPMPVALLDPCALIQPSDLAGHGAFKAQERYEVDDARICSYSRDGASGFEQRFMVSVGIRDDQNADSVQERGRGRTLGNVNGRKTVKVPSTAFDCLLVVAIDEKSRADILILGTGMDSCALAEQLADVVEPRLPKR
ncbi:hypothetical protein GCM10022247_03000 [Allokutzneria multivorans]|uniref:DUF3558 domain-containing protein n=1 Tax=Allokutzneria multivorans TaxID=1142134 RepID=A0ABP7QTS8_9PSEU